MGAGKRTPPARREISARRLRWLDGDYDDDEEYVLEEEEDCAEELSASSAGEEGEGSDAEYQQDEEEEEEIETPRPKRSVKGSDRGRKGKVNPAAARSRRRKYEEDDDYEEEEVEEEEEMGENRDELQEVEEEEEEVPPRPKSLAKCGGRSRNVKPATAANRSHQQRHLDDDYEEEEEVEEEDEVEEYHDELEEVEEEEEEYRDELEEVEEEEEEVPPRPKSLAKCGGRSRNVKPATSAKRSNQRRHLDDDDIDFDPELDDEEELDEDIDFDPEADDDDEDEYQDEEEEELSAFRSRKVTVKNPAKRKSVSKRRTLKKKKKKSKGSKASGKKSASAKAKKSAPVRRRKKRSVIDEYEDDDDDDEDDDDFIVEDERPRKKARTRNGREAEVDPEVSPVEEETWPNLESDTSDFEFATSDEEHNDVDTPVVEHITVKKGRKKRVSGSESSSDSEFIVSDKELEDLRETELPKPVPMLPASVRRLCITRHGEGKGKEKQEQESGKPICGICLSEEQRATVQGVLNCCSHYFCFACIMEWSRVESRCPLCKQRFTTITKSSKVDLGLGVRKAVIKVEERDQVYQPTEEEIRRWLDPYENVVCIECNQGGDDSLMLLCDICDSSAHTYCVGLGREVPEGNWYCGGCRLGDEGPSYTGIQRTVAYERQNYRIVDNSFGTAAPSGTLERPPSINTRRSFQGIDLNLSPREFPGETHTAESQVSTDSVLTPTGGRATLSGRRQIHRYIRILLTRPRPPSRPDAYHNIAQHSGGVPRAEPNRRNLPSSSEANTSHSLPDGIQNHHNGLPFVQAHNNFAPCMPLDGDEGVKSNLRNL